MAATICIPCARGVNIPTTAPDWGTFARALTRAQARHRLAAVTTRLAALEAEAATLRADLTALRAVLGQP